MELLNEQSERRALVDVKVGDGVKIFNFVNAYGCEIGSGTKIGSFVEIQKGVRIGANCKVSSHSFICEGVVIEDGVFVGHGVIFINDRFPKAVTDSGAMKSEDDWTLEPTIIKKNVGIGSGAVIMCGVTIGEGATIGAGAVVTKDVEPFAVIAGVPARLIRFQKHSK